MKGKEELEIIITEEGEVRILVKGIKGPSCMKTAETFAGKIGNIKEMAKTMEFYQKPETTLQIKETGKKSP
ncbi:MAG TPA: DUF2997 domain-containing protein [bacterium]|nr:DUF2997 domain-containing protein [bacterium]